MNLKPPDFEMSQAIMSEEQKKQQSEPHWYDRRSDPNLQNKLQHEAKRRFVTAPFDPRFPNTNQALYCWSSYLDYHRCLNARGKDYEPCIYFKRMYGALCPSSWYEKWDTQIEEGTFPGKI